ncbi:MAG: peptide chain release factor N(5)-glutamine methyltransferase [Gammaproteobacteria bacterium]|nr:peptide chain release factor N(5)-glutamine methyltransferase [Gammaproteobacteria bacterium]
MPTLGQTTSDAAQLLASISDSPRLDAEVLIAHALQIPRARFITDPDLELTPQQCEAIDALIQRRAKGEPIAYILGNKHFWDLELTVSPAVLIPRPDTEVIVETALTLFPEDTAIDAIDLGTGSGAIAIAIAKARPGWHVCASDASKAALAIAIENAEHYQLHNLTLLQSHWFDELVKDKKYDLILSNPPYIPEHDPHLQQGDVRYEPQQALISGADGLDDIRHLIAESQHHLKPGGYLMLEHGYDQGERVYQLFVEQGYRDVQQRKDFGGHIRVTFGKV